MAITYRLGRSVYVALTNRTNTTSLLQARGPGFVMPAASGFAPLPPKFEPEAAEVLAALEPALHPDTDERVSAVVFAGVGEPLLRIRVLEGVATALSAAHGSVALRVNTNGCMPASEAPGVALRLKKAGLMAVSVAIATHDPEQYDSLMQPEPLRYSPAFSLPLGHAEVCCFVQACVAQGLQVECTAAAVPGVDIGATAELAGALGASFRERSWHPGT